MHVSAVRRKIEGEVTGGSLVFNDADYVRADGSICRAGSTGGKREVGRLNRPAQMHRVKRPVRVAHRLRIDEKLSLFGDVYSARDDGSRMEITQIIRDQNVGVPSRCYLPHLARYAKVVGGVDGSHLDGAYRIEAGTDRVTEHAVHVTFVDERLRV